jgi:RNA polymerase-associated protein CTR9
VSRGSRLLTITDCSIFRALADDRSGALPYDADLADQRAKYGDGLLKRAPEQLEKQQVYESEAQARVEEARRIRDEEKKKLQEAEVSYAGQIEAKPYGLGRTEEGAGS